MIIVSPSFRWFWGPPTQNHRVPCYRCWLVAYPAATDSPVLFSFSLFSSCFSIRLTESCCWRVVRHELHIAAEKYMCVCVYVCIYAIYIYIYVSVCVCSHFSDPKMAVLNSRDEWSNWSNRWQVKPLLQLRLDRVSSDQKNSRSWRVTPWRCYNISHLKLIKIDS